ncbi:MAG: DUF2019 domain-containing protein [Phycisphaeraceae bacterium]|nr:MAG: DUF2019 domain-containing protein [Phycisphaeraceae bacterium]
MDSNPQYTDKETEVLRRRFIALSWRKYNNIYSPGKHNYAFTNMVRLCSAIYAKEGNLRRVLMPLLQYQDDCVRANAAFYMIWEEPDEATAVLRQVAQADSPYSFLSLHAEDFLEGWQDGKAIPLHKPPPDHK